MPVILVLGKLSVENCEFEASYDHMGKKGGGSQDRGSGSVVGH